MDVGPGVELVRNLAQNALLHSAVKERMVAALTDVTSPSRRAVTMVAITIGRGGEGERGNKMM